MTNPARRRRPGSISTAVLFSLPLALMLLFVAINHMHLAYARVATQRVTDASALAAAQALVVDAHLTADASDLEALQATAEAQAQAIADLNPLSPAGLVYEVTQPDACANDILFTVIDNPLDPSGTLQLIESIEVFGVRMGDSAVPIYGGPLFTLQTSNVVTRSKALIDRYVLGLRPVLGQNVPLAPIALLDTDWAAQVQVTVGPPHTISDYTVTLGDPLAPMSSFLFIGTTTLTEASAQLANGVSPADLAGLNGEFVLDSNGELDVPGELTSTDSAGLEDVRTQLLALEASGEARAWPLYSTNAAGETTVNGFVAARVVNVGTVAMVGTDATLSVTLEPAFLSSPSVATDPGRPVNPYLARVRLAN